MIEVILEDIGIALYLVGTILVTIVFNVPRNDALASIDPASANGASLWAGYLISWTAWNHVRTVAALAAAASLTIALVSRHGAWANIPPKRNRREPIYFSPIVLVIWSSGSSTG